MASDHVVFQAPGEWTRATLGALCEGQHATIQTGPFGSQLHKSDYVDVGVPVVMPKDIGNDRIESYATARVPEDKARELSRHRLRRGDLVYSRRGDVERRAQVTETQQGWLCGTGCLLVRPDPEKIDTDFLYYYLGHPNVRAWVTRHAVGATMANLNTSILRELPVIVPPETEQDAITEVLSALDDKIELLYEQSRSSREVVRAIYDGLLDNSGKQLAMADLARYVNGGAFTKQADGQGRLIIRIAELNNGPGASSKYGSFEVDAEHLAGPGDLLFSWSGTLDVFRWTRDEAIINQHIFKVICDQGWPQWFVYCALQQAMPFFRGLAADKVTTMGHIKRGHLEQAHVARPTADYLQYANAAAEPLWGLHLQVSREAGILEELRETLLPKLLSGELRLPDAERLVGAA